MRDDGDDGDGNDSETTTYDDEMMMTRWRCPKRETLEDKADDRRQETEQYNDKR